MAAALLVGGLGCSDSEDPPAASAGAGGASATAGAAGSSGAAGASGSAGSAGSGGGSSGTGGASGAAGTAGAAGGGAPDAGGDCVPAAGKLVALTFDDGPEPALTAAVLDKLEAHQVPASFFLVGQRINAGAQAVLDRAAALGCTFENHSNDYSSLNASTAEQIEAAVNGTTALIEQFTEQSPAFFRPPNLAVSQTMLDTIDLPFAGGLVGGDFPGGNAGGNPTVDSVSNTIINGVQDGTIILLHDVQPSLDPQVTPDALDNIIPALKSQDYEFVTLRELFARRCVDPSSQPDTVWAVVPPN